MHDYCPRRPEPRFEGGDPGEVVSLPHHDVGTGLQQVLLHVVPEVVQEFHLGDKRKQGKQLILNQGPFTRLITVGLDPTN